MNANITLLGMPDSGKTNFISEAIRDINSFAPKITIRHVASTQTDNVGVVCNDRYILKAYDNIEWIFSMCDYEGDLLKTHGNDNEELKKYLYFSDTWIVLIDSISFHEDTDDKIVRKIKRNSARILLPYISDYTEKHSEKMPELLFVVSKADRLIRKFTAERIRNIIIESYEGVFSEETSPMILLSETSNTKSAGLAVLSLFYMKYAKELADTILQLEHQNEQIVNNVSNLQSLCYEIENKKILRNLPGNKRKLEDYNRQMLSLNTEISNNNNKIAECRNDMGLRHLGTCVQCLINNNKQMLINGFDRIDFQYDMPGIKAVERSQVTTAALVFNAGTLIVLYLYLLNKVKSVTFLGCTVITSFFIFLIYKLENTAVRIVLGICSALAVMKLCTLAGQSGCMLMLGYIVWFILSMSVTTMWEKRKSKYSDIIYFFDKRARGKD